MSGTGQEQYQTENGKKEEKNRQAEERTKETRCQK